MKGCLSIFVKILVVILAYIGFQSLGGVDFVKDKFVEYTTPSQETLIEKAKSIADLSHLNDEYMIDRTANVLGYDVVLAEHKNSGQKIALIEPKDEDLLTQKDFKSGDVNKKLHELINKFQYQLVRLENFEVTKKGTYIAMGQKVPYVRFEADTVNMPIGHISGTIGVAKNKSGKNIILTSVNNDDKYSQIITEEFFRKVK
ncbi:MAG: hypothetical protein PHV37_04120 [Candidatus Gastranaerophilales bacterium]|nr:hypothetical protein [Candidatus Gastranaerophilales bacterium]